MTVRTVRDFFEWCGQHGLADAGGLSPNYEEIGRILRYSTAVVASWHGTSAANPNCLIPARARRTVSFFASADLTDGFPEIPHSIVTDVTVGDFFDWCNERGFVFGDVVDTKGIAKLFKFSPQTVRNWHKKSPDAPLPAWVGYVLLHYDLNLSMGVDGAWIYRDVPDMSIQGIKDWGFRNGLSSYEDVGSVFGITRQAVYNWYCRGRFPNWLGLGCAGHEAVIRSKGDEVPSARDSAAATRMNGELAE